MPKPQSDDVLYRLPQAAMRLGIAVKTLRHWCAAGRIGYVKISPRSVRVPASELNRIVSEGTRAAKRGTA